MNGPTGADGSLEPAPAVEPSSPVPLYYQVANALESSIYAGTYPPGSLLGTEKELAETFGVSRITVRKASELLNAEGLLRAQVGRGTFVSDTARPRAPAAYHAFLDDFLARSDALITLEVDHAEVPAPHEAATALGIRPGTSVMRIDRHAQGLTNQSPGIWVVYFLSLDIWRKLDLAHADLHDVRLLRRIDQTPGLRLASGDQVVNSIAADRATAARFGVAPGTPLLRVERHFHAGDGRTVAYGWVDYPSGAEILVFLSRVRR